MNSIGIDLHKESISVCVMSPERQLLTRRRMACKDPAGMAAFFQTWSPFQGVMEATSSYEWLFRLLEPMAERVVLAHPQKLRMIAESARKSDRLDAQVLAKFLALDMIPPAWCGTAAPAISWPVTSDSMHSSANTRSNCSCRMVRSSLPRANTSQPASSMG